MPFSVSQSFDNEDDNGEHDIGHSVTDSFSFDSVSRQSQPRVTQDEVNEFIAEAVAAPEVEDEPITELPTELLLINMNTHQRNSARQKEKSALSKINLFLKEYCRQKEEAVVTCHDLLLKQNPDPNNNNEKSPRWFDDMFGHFVYYLANFAFKYGTEARGRISYQAATGYMSSCKVFFEKKFAYDDIAKISVFRQTHWRQLRSKLLANYQELARPTGESLTDPHIASSESDRMALALACCWKGDRKSAEFLHLNNTMMQFSGRGSEVSLHCVGHIACVPRTEHGAKYYVLQSFVKRQKNGQEQKLPIYPSATGWEQDWYFSLLYRILLVGNESDHIFPEFAEKALHARDNLNDSKVSALWRDYFKDIYQYLTEIEGIVVTQLNQKLSSHHAKKGSNEEMAQSSACSGLAQIFRTGWEVASIHSIFDYVIGTMKMLHRAGKVVSGWTAKVGDDILGGQPPTVADIHTERHRLESFINWLFIEDTTGMWDRDIRSVLAGSLFRHWNKFVASMEEHPQKLYDNLTNHPFVCHIYKAMSQSGVTIDLFSSWCKEVETGFITRNIVGLSIEVYRDRLALQGPATEPNSILMDPRNLITHHNSLVEHYLSLCNNFNQLQEKQNSTMHQMSAMEERVDNISEQLQFVSLQNVELLELTRALFTAKTTGEDCTLPVNYSTRPTVVTPKTPSPTKEQSPASSPSFVTYFTTSVRVWKKNPSIGEIYTSFFLQKLWIGYSAELQSPEHDARNDGDKKKVRNKYSRIKKGVNMMLRLACTHGGFPVLDNQPDFETEHNYMQLVKDQGKSIEAQLKEELKVDALTLTSLLANKTTQEWLDPKSSNYRDLPRNTPDDFIELFTLQQASGKRKAPGTERGTNDNVTP